MNGLPRIGLFVGEWGSQNMVELLVRSCSLFNSLQKIQDSVPSSSRNDHLTLGPSDQEMAYYSRFATLYRAALSAFLEKAQDSTLSSSSSTSNQLPPKLQAKELRTILHLAQVIFIPADGRGLGVVGEELLDWLNEDDPGPTEAQGMEIAFLKTPYESDQFATYILSCVLRGSHPQAAAMMRTLSTSPYPTLVKVSTQIADLLDSFPRSTKFDLESEFLASRRKWISQLRSLINSSESEFNQLEDELAEIGGFEGDELINTRCEWQAELGVLMRVMLGDKDSLLEVCSTWAEALGAWGVLVSPGLKRNDIPQVAQLIFESFRKTGKSGPEFDSNVSKAEQMMRELALNNPVESIKLSQSVDPWLSCHLTDLFSRMGILSEESRMMDQDEQEDFNTLDSDLRFESIENYASYLLEDQGLWRIALDYLSQNQVEDDSGANSKLNRARRAMRAVIMKVPVLGTMKGKARQLDDDRVVEDDDGESEVAKQQVEKDEFETADELIEACDFFNLQKEKRLICKKIARELSAQSRFSPSLVFAILASDLSLIQQISDVVLDTYIEQGAKAFISLVDSLPQGLLSPFPIQEDEEEDRYHLDSEADDLEMQDADQMEEDDEQTRRSKSKSKAIKTSSQKRERLATQLALQGGLNVRLLFLGYYRDFLRDYQEGNLRNSARLIIELLQSEFAPERFWAVLLIDSVPLLKSLDPPYFTSAETFELMRCVESVTSSSTIHPKQASYWLSCLEKVLFRISKFSNDLEGNEDELLQLENELQMEIEKDLDGGEGKELNSNSILKRLDVVRLFAARHLAKESAGRPGYH